MKKIIIIIFLITGIAAAEKTGIEGYYFVTGNNVRVRSTPSLKGKITGAYNSYDVVHVSSKSNKTEENGKEYYWYKTDDGWMYSKFLKPIPDDPEEIVKELSSISFKHEFLDSITRKYPWSDLEEQGPVAAEGGPDPATIDPISTLLYFKNAAMYYRLDLDMQYLQIDRIVQIKKKDKGYLFTVVHIYSDNSKTNVGSKEELYIYLDDKGSLHVGKWQFYN